MDKRKIVTVLGLFTLSVGALLITSCGTEQDMVAGDQGELSLDDSSQNMFRYNGLWTEYGNCNDTLDNDGNGLIDSEDPACHLNVTGPLRDLSFQGFPQGHNYFPLQASMAAGSPGIGGDFRYRDQMGLWIKYLTEMDGSIAGAPLAGLSRDPGLVPLLQTATRPYLGTNHQGNSNNWLPNAYWPRYPFVDGVPRYLPRSLGLQQAVGNLGAGAGNVLTAPAAAGARVPLSAY